MQNVIFSRYFDGAAAADEKGWEAELLRLAGGCTEATAGAGQEQVAMSGDKCVVWCVSTDTTVFVAGTDEHDEIILLEVVHAFLSMVRAVTKRESVNAASIMDNYAKVALYADELVTPAGEVQHWDYSQMR